MSAPKTHPRKVPQARTRFRHQPIHLHRRSRNTGGGRNGSGRRAGQPAVPVPPVAWAR